MLRSSLVAALVLLGVLLIAKALRFLCRRRRIHYRRRKTVVVIPQATPVELPQEPSRGRRKPEWVRNEVLRLKAIIGDISTRKLSETFNRLHEGQASIGKTFVADLLKAHEYRIACLTRDLRNRPPKPYRINAVWALDFTFQTDADGKPHAVLGLIDHGSRVLRALKRLTNRNAWTVLGHLCLAIAEFGKPCAIRTDNEAVFRSRLLRIGLKLSGIRRQFTQPHSPWQNGRIERLFGTLKPLLRRVALANVAALDAALFEFRLFYNHVRTHQYLGGRTPAEVWRAGSADGSLEPVREPPKLVAALGGRLVGYYLRR